MELTMRQTPTPKKTKTPKKKKDGSTRRQAQKGLVDLRDQPTAAISKEWK